MKDFLLITFLITLMTSLIFLPMGGLQSGLGSCQSGMTNGNSGIGNGCNTTANGHLIGKGHFNNQGKGLGHVKHGNNTLCPICGGSTCIPPCPNAD